MCLVGHIHICLASSRVVLKSDLESSGQLLGRVRIGVKSSKDLYYQKHKTRTWIRRRYKVTKPMTFWVDSVAYTINSFCVISVITCSIVMSRRVALCSSLCKWQIQSFKKEMIKVIDRWIVRSIRAEQPITKVAAFYDVDVCRPSITQGGGSSCQHWKDGLDPTSFIVSSSSTMLVMPIYTIQICVCIGTVQTTLSLSKSHSIFGCVIP